MRRFDEPQYNFKPSQRTTQIIYGERQHLRAVLVSIRNFPHHALGLERETETLHRMIDARTAELNQITPNFDHLLRQARDPEATPDHLALLADSAPGSDWLLLRTITENSQTPAEVLARLASHPYDAVRENVARHPRADTATLEKLAADPEGEIWLLVACNEAAPPELRKRLSVRFDGKNQPASSARK